ncbi:MlaD family protein [Gordonia otitidis]|uniref:Mce family protein n=1 Tax=Gordonia otitidis (strain DSM 44809 / CCUG 52243 / JCM 12355 / NBRC 100426 / IFM 10032) TaxID=1108044 RepID=H5TRW4_GORO1|nr:MlaD family protein [Gordonia otitidis]GAB36222.1 Mce family protein [Gordonia otitidis NBRC 100426]
MMRRGMSLGLCVLAVVAALAVVAIGRGTNPANLLPKLTSSSSDSKTIYVDFSSVVNLPLGARVLSRGTQIGTLESIALVPNAARLTLGIKPQAQVRVGSKAELRQSTMLGDIYVALIPPTRADAAVMHDGDTIGLHDTDPGPQIEDIITNLADFMAGGSLMRVQESIRKVNESVDIKDGDLPAASRVGAQDISDLARGTDHLSSMIDTLDSASHEIASDPQLLALSMGPQGQFAVGAVFDAISEGFKLVAGSSALAIGLSWLTPRLAELNPFLEKIIPLLRSYSATSTQFNGNIGKVIDVTKTKLIPFAGNGGVSVDKVTVGADHREVTQSVAAVLRMIGALR